MTKAANWVFALLCLHAVFAKDYPFPPPPSSSECSFGVDNDNVRLDCYPEAFSSEEGCVARGCCWRPTTIGRPFCYYPENFAAFEHIDGTNQTKRIYRSQFPGDIEIFQTIIEETDGYINMKISDPANNRFVPPYPKLNLKKQSDSVTLSVINKGNYAEISINERMLTTIQFSNFIFADQFLQITLGFPGATLYGVGEHRTKLVLDDNWTKYTLWNHDVAPRDNTNLYGSHPFVLAVDENGQAGGIYLHNSNAMEILIQPGPLVTFRTIGGILDLYYFTGPTPADVIRQYTQLIGLPAMPPYWALGFNLCRWGYGSANNTRAVWQRMRDAQIPFDVQWNDIDYMQNNNDFTIDPVNYKELPQLVDDIHAAGMHYVAMLDPGVSGSEPEGSYPPYSDGVAMDTFVKDDAGNIFIGHVWNPADTVYPDFTHPRAVEYWTKQLREFRDKIKYDALWIDMNEPSNFFDGLENGCPDNNLENPPYAPPVDGKLTSKTLCLSARHAAGPHYNIHNLHAIAEADVTRRAAEDILQKRTFLITRASFSGIGRYSGHWSGDNNSAWSEMVSSVIEVLTFGLYGVPLMGADICGFGGEANKELCNRWMQLGAFYPFSRNHNIIGSKDQDPASYDDEFVASVRKALNVRYSLLPYLYTLFYEAEVSASTVARALVLEFPADPVARKIDTAFLWGSGLYVIPVLEEGGTSVTAYLPAARWFDFYSGVEKSRAGNESLVLDAPFDTIPLLLCGGNILPSQAPAVTTTESRKNPFSFIVVPDANGNAIGNLFWDDGVTLDTIGKGEIGLLNLASTEGRFTTSVSKWNTSDTPVVSSVKVLGVTNASQVTVNGQSATFNLDNNQVLMVDVPNIGLDQPIDVSWK